MKILICEDDKNIAEAMKIILTDSGYQVDLEFDSDKVLGKIKKTNPDLIILDLCLSGVDGKTLSKEIKTNQELRSMPVVMISASNQLEKITQELLVDDFLPKPFDIDDLLAVVKKYARSVKS